MNMKYGCCDQFFIFIFTILLANNLSAEVAESQVFALSGIDPPHTLISENGLPVGTEVKKVREILDMGNLRYEIKLLPWARVLSESEGRRDTLVFNIFRTKVREKKYLWLAKLGSIRESLISRNTPVMNRLHHQEIIAGSYSAICVRDTSQCDALSKYGFKASNIITVSTKSTNQLVNLLARHRADFALVNVDDINVGNEKGIYSMADFHVHFTQPTLDYYMAAPLGFNPTLLKEINLSVIKWQYVRTDKGGS